MSRRGIRGGVSLLYNFNNLPAQPSNPMVPFAFRWTAAGGLQPLSPAPGSAVRAASTDGQRIAGSTFEDGIGTRPLADALAGVDLGGMTLGDPIALSADGSTLVGHATCAGTAAAFGASLPR